ncbi:phospholipase D-like domain-containing protein [Lysobacter capsici]|uniref:phospholipase D-like domain-containing protein n=1 Tax=Lysobacter capsici TaxID=435897 RepID=UPI001782BFDB|nr:phospholipase D-like domain-containing protein [Lysobacter capsici]UOF14477.1 phospholipase D-like domain-containing protein [Lysobacter capsici]
MAEPLSLVNAIRKDDIDASLITTLNANLPYYEDFILRRLASVGCRNNVLLVDQKQLSSAYLSEATRPRRAGIDYTMVPIDVQGAFHPKICLLAGKKRASLFVGSHNLTVSGFGYNREVTNHLEIPGANWKSEPNLFSQAWASARDWIMSMSDRLPSALLESAYTLDNAFGGAPGKAAPKGGAGFLTQFPGGESLLDQLAHGFDEEVRQITLLGVFFDTRAEFLLELLKRWPKSEAIVGIHPDTVWLSHIPSGQTLPAQPSQVIEAERWFDKHRAIAHRLSGMADDHLSSVSGPIFLGDIVHAPPRVSFPTIAVDSDGNYVSVVEEEGKELRFLATRVVTLARI